MSSVLSEAAKAREKSIALGNVEYAGQLASGLKEHGAQYTRFFKRLLLMALMTIPSMLMSSVFWTKSKSGTKGLRFRVVKKIQMPSTKKGFFLTKSFEYSSPQFQPSLSLSGFS